MHNLVFLLLLSGTNLFLLMNSTPQKHTFLSLLMFQEILYLLFQKNKMFHLLFLLFSSGINLHFLTKYIHQIFFLYSFMFLANLYFLIMYNYKMVVHQFLLSLFEINPSLLMLCIRKMQASLFVLMFSVNL